MKLTLKHAVATIFLVLSFAAPVTAGPSEDAALRIKKEQEQFEFASALHAKGDKDGLWLLEGLAIGGNTAAQLKLGEVYSKGVGVPQDYAKAAKWFRWSANEGNAFAQFILGEFYSQGKGVPQDYAEASRWYEMAASHGDAEYQHRWGEIIRNGRFIRKDSVQNCKREEAERKLDIDTEIMVKRLTNRNSDERSFNREWQEKINESYARKEACAAKAAEVERTSDKDAAEALEWFRKAADQGYVKAMNDLGSYYRNKNPVLAHMWLNLAAARGDQSAAIDRDALARHMTPAQVAEAQKLAREWKPTK